MTSVQQRDAHAVLAAIDEVPSAAAQAGRRGRSCCAICPDANIADLDAAGFFKMVQPEQWGGLQMRPHPVLRGGAPDRQRLWIHRLGRRHPGCAWHLAQFDQQAQEDVWGSDPSVRISSSYAPMGAGQVVGGGLSGQRHLAVVLRL